MARIMKIIMGGERRIYALGLLGVLSLMGGIVMHLTCSTTQPCLFEAWERKAYYIGHTCLLLSALLYCFTPMFKKCKFQ